MQTSNSPLVSVVMIACNVERFLSEAIESVLAQTFRDFEFIVLDYGSTDTSKDIVSAYAAKDSRVKLHTAPPCTYIEAKIIACSLARGRYIAIQDADDNSLPNRLSWEVEFMEKNPDVAVVGSAADWINSAGKFLLTSRPPTSHEGIRRALLTSSPFVHTSVLMRRDIYTQVGGYRRALLYAEDFDLFARMSERFPCANLNHVAVQYRIHGRQLSLVTRRQQVVAKLAAGAAATARQAQHVDPLDSIPEISESFLPALGVSPAQFQAALFWSYQDWVYNMFLAGEYSVALKTALEVLASDWEGVDRKQIADLRLMVGRLLWKQRQFVPSLVSASRAVVAKPTLVRELQQSLWRKARLS
jgi:glycosyltransferase involved in cell wall biosynthesis